MCRGVSAGDAGSTNAVSAGRPRLVALGDSITAGYGLDVARAWPALLQRKLEAAGLRYEVANAGVSGDTTAGGLRRVDWALRPGSAVLIVALGGNDGLRGLPPEQTAQNLAGIVQRARAKIPGITVFIAGMEMPPSFGSKYVDAYRAVFPQVARENGATLIPFLLEGVGGVAELNQPDLIHPTAEGQQRIAETVWKIVQPVLEKRPATLP